MYDVILKLAVPAEQGGDGGPGVEVKAVPSKERFSDLPPALT